MNCKFYGNMVKNRTTSTPPAKLNLLPVICRSNYYNLYMFCDFMCRKECYRLPNYDTRKSFIRESALKILVSTSPKGKTYFLEEIEKHPEDTFENLHYHELCENGKKKQYDMVPLGIVSGNSKEANALYLTHLPPDNYTDQENFIWLTPDEIMEKVKEGVWLPNQVNTIANLLNSLLNLPELATIHNTKKRVSW